MAVVAFASAKGAPGVTTSTLALAFAWHRPVLVVEADMTGSSSVLSGFLRGTTDQSRGLVGLSVSARQHGFTDQGLWEQCLRLAEERYLLPGIADPAQAAALSSAWPSIAVLLAELEAAGVDVLVDAGRVGTAYAPMSLLRAADAAVLVSGTRLPDVWGYPVLFNQDEWGQRQGCQGLGGSGRSAFASRRDCSRAWSIPRSEG